MNQSKLILKEQSFFEDFIFTLKTLAVNAGQTDSSDVMILIPEADESLGKKLAGEGIKARIELYTKEPEIPKTIRYLFILSDEKSRIKKLSVNPLLSGLTLIYTAQFPCPNQLNKLPYFNAAASATRNYG